MSRASENQSFTCAHCGQKVNLLTNGSYRNHCPRCLWSLHVDNQPGDRQSNCGALMSPVELAHPTGKKLAVVHRCGACGQQSTNRLALDDAQQPDSYEAIARLQQHSVGTGRVRRRL